MPPTSRTTPPGTAKEESPAKEGPIPSKTSARKASEVLCDTHHKKIEAFCDQDKKVLCIDCILNENHKSHEILSIAKASEREREEFEKSISIALPKEGELQHQIHRVKAYLGELEDTANRNRSQISSIFNEIRAKVVEREGHLKRQISDILEKEQSFWKKKISEFEE